MHFELAQMEERLGEFERARDAYACSIHACPFNLRWKIWLSGARMELLSGSPARVAVARALLSRALEEVPKKMRCMVLLEQARAEEFLGFLPEARRILRQAQTESKLEWKVFLESVLLELRANRIDDAIHEAEAALEVHNGTGRLWAILIQLKQKQKHALGHRLGHASGSLKQQWAIFKLAIKEVPKSGEVWCEGARLVLNPHATKYFNLRAAKRFLNFAITFTPQYGDSFIEYLRLKMILEGMDDAAATGNMSAHANVSMSAAAASAVAAGEAAGGGLGSSGPRDSFSGSGCGSGSSSGSSHLRRVQQLCVNAEPNYGSSWFSCKREAHWSPVEVLAVAGDMIQQHLVANQRQYQQAILQGWYRKDDPPPVTAVAVAAAADVDAATTTTTTTATATAATARPQVAIGLSSLQARLDAEADEVAAAAAAAAAAASAALIAGAASSSADSPVNSVDSRSSSPSSSYSDGSSSSSSSPSASQRSDCMSVESDAMEDEIVSAFHTRTHIAVPAPTAAAAVSSLPPMPELPVPAITSNSNKLPSLNTSAAAAVAAGAMAAAVVESDVGMEDGAFSPSTVRRAAAIELGESSLLSAACSPCHSQHSSDCSASSSWRATPDSTSSALLTSEDDEDDLQAEYQPDAEFNSLQILYPPIANLSVQERHRALYGADPIAP